MLWFCCDTTLRLGLLLLAKLESGLVCTLVRAILLPLELYSTFYAVCFHGRLLILLAVRLTCVP